MYIWVGIDVDGDWACIKDRAKEIEETVGFAHSNFTLPFHISLKISFAVNDLDADRVIADIENFYRTLKSVPIEVKGIEYENTITWIRYRDNARLNEIHDALNDLLLQKHGIGLHEYDRDYKFHTTLFMDDNAAKVRTAYKMIRDAELIPSLTADKFIIGTSPTGKLGSYRVFKTIKLD